MSEDQRLPLRVISQEQLDAVLEDSRRWFETGGREGSPANLSRTMLKNCQLSDAILAGGDLKEADLSFANLEGADLRGADLSRAELVGTDLRDADLSGANLFNANFFGADLRDAGFIVANLTRANVSNGLWFGAILEGATLIDILGSKSMRKYFGEPYIKTRKRRRPRQLAGPGYY